MLHKKLLPILFIIVSITGFCSFAKEGYHIKVTINGLQDTTTILAYYYGANQYIHDSTYVDKNGFFEFSGTEKLDKGMYLIVLPGNKFFDIIIDKNQHFEITTDLEALVENMKFNNSPENNSFYDYLRQMRPISEKMSEIRQAVMELAPESEKRAGLMDQHIELQNQIDSKRQDYIKSFPDGLFSAILKAQQDVPVPAPRVREDGTPDRSSVYNEYIVEYWKNIDFSDDRLVRTPVFHQKLNHFFNSVVIQLPDSVISVADRLIEKARAHEEVFKYTVWFIMNHSERSNIMGMDKVLVHLADKYYFTGEAFWVDEGRIERLKTRVETLRPLLIGAVAPEIEVFTPDKDTISLHSVDAKYTVLYFWDSECSFCKKVTPKLQEIYKKLKPIGLEVFAMNVEADREKWLEYVKKNNMDWINAHDPVNTSGFRDKYDIYSIPVIFVLDVDKKILAKKITPEQLESLIEYMEEQNK